MKSKAASFASLMKPYIMLLVLLTGATSLVLEGSLLKHLQTGNITRFVLILLALLLIGGSANAFNMFFERKVDARMARTRDKRPLPLGKISPFQALIFAIIIGIGGIAILAVFFNLFSAALALATILFYSLFYTLYLKPRTPYNIVIGGAAGSMAPVIAWVAAAGKLAPAPVLLSAIVFLWTPPHFWSLALYTRKDYELVNYPMMPIARGTQATRRQIFFYVITLVLISATCIMVGAGLFYILLASLAGIMLIFRTAKMMIVKADKQARSLFRFSIVYLLMVFIGLIIDSLVRIPLR